MWNVRKRMLAKLYETADIDEPVRSSKALPLLSFPEVMVKRVKEGIKTSMTRSSRFTQKPVFTPKEIGGVDGVLGATIVWGQGKGIFINVEHADPSK